MPCATPMPGGCGDLAATSLDVFTAATLMGHTMKVHEKTYRSHIDRREVAVGRARGIIAEALQEES